MSSKRAVALMALLLVLMAGYAAYPRIEDWYYFGRHAEKPAEPLPGINKVTNLQVKLRPDGKWGLSFDYFYTGAPAYARVQLDHLVDGQPNGEAATQTIGLGPALRGQQRFEGELPMFGVEARNSHKVTVALRAGPRTLVEASQVQTIPWPDMLEASIRELVGKSDPAPALESAEILIDRGDEVSLDQARKLLLALVDKHPKADHAYVELARVAMKTQWNEGGLAQAEALIRSALQIRPDSANAKILLGYVHANRGRYKEAEALFAEVGALNPPVKNIWLWTNWGELREQEGRRGEAIAKYREAVAQPPTSATYERARRYAYDKAVVLLEAGNDVDAADAMHRQRTQAYPKDACLVVAHARFVALQRGDTAAAAQLLQTAERCPLDRVQPVQALLHYVNWAGSGEPPKAEVLNQARAIMPASPHLFYVLAGSDRSAEVLRKLVTVGGEKIGMRDAARMDALAIALSTRDFAAASRLLKLGAKPDALIGPQGMPVALLPVMMRDFEGIRLMRRAGIDYRKLAYAGQTAVQQARQAGDAPLVRALAPDDGTL